MLFVKQNLNAPLFFRLQSYISIWNNVIQIKKINNLDNLIYLCPNHHAMLDKGLLNMEGMAGVEPASSNYPDPT